MEIVKFDYSQSEMVAYLITKGCKYSNVFVKMNSRYKGNYKVFFTFEGKREDFIKFNDEFNNESNIKLKDYIKNLFEVKRVISRELNKYK